MTMVLTLVLGVVAVAPVEAMVVVEAVKAVGLVC